MAAKLRNVLLKRVSFFNDALNTFQDIILKDSKLRIILLKTVMFLMLH